MRWRRTYAIRGIVQGVGFRPAVQRLALQAGLGGSVRNGAGTAELVLEGESDAIDAFLSDLPGNLLPPASIHSITLQASHLLPACGVLAPFAILPSRSLDRPLVAIPPDLRLCSDCLHDILDPSNRRFGYAFTTCTRCGPRYTVTRQTPFDRVRTSLDRFPPCADCRTEYADPSDRRYHAETLACPACGPQLRFLDVNLAPMPGDPLRQARAALARGLIVAVRGIGGFLLAADAGNRAVLTRLRERKQRPSKPLAVMARDLDAVRRVCEVPPAAVELLQSNRGPIVILDTRPGTVWPLDLLAPDTRTLGVMLPTSPLHQLLATRLPGDPVPDFDLLVMTSGNRCDEPICRDNQEAAERLRGLADCLLTHDRDVLLRCDDSVAVIRRGAPQLWRRARGYAAAPLALRHPVQRRVLAAGADSKNSLAFAHDATLVLLPHTGDLDTPEARDDYAGALERLPGFLRQAPDVVAVDRHPGMAATRAAQAFAVARGLPVVAVQHHQAHAAACLAENGYDSGLALVFDGTGYGDDGATWGAELLQVEASSYRRLATFAAASLPGGDTAIRNPVRQAVARLAAAGLSSDAIRRRLPGLTEEQADVWRAQAGDAQLAPRSHACGRVFDSMAVLLGAAPGTLDYEGQPAIRLEALACRSSFAAATGQALPFWLRERGGLLEIDWTPAVLQLAQEVPADEQAAATAACAFHRAVVQAAVAMVEYGAGKTDMRRVALSGGVFMNRLIDAWLTAALTRMGFEVLTHQSLPPNDGGIAAGQAVVAGWKET